METYYYKANKGSLKWGEFEIDINGTPITPSETHIRGHPYLKISKLFVVKKFKQNTIIIQ